MFDSAPEPISGDGHIIAPAIWSSSHCALFATQGTLPSCTTTTNFSVAIPTAFEGTASVFVYADPLRGAGLSNGRGRVPGAVRLRVDEAQQKGFVDIRVKARYERGRPDLLRGATVARVTGSTHEGLGIYVSRHCKCVAVETKLTLSLHPQTPVLSSAYLGRVAPPLSFDIEVVLPSAALIPSLRIHASAMDIWHMSNPPITDPHVRLFPFHNMGASGELVGSDANGGATKDNEPTFGVLKLSSGDGAIKVGPVGAKAVGGVKLRSTSGGIVVAGPVDTQALEVTSDNGKITMQSWVKAWKDVKLITLNGDVNLAKGSEVMCETIEARSRNGNVGGQGVWATVSWRVSTAPKLYLTNAASFLQNGTLILKSDSGRISSSISILPTKGASVSVTAHSGNEAVSLYYVAHALGVALQSKARSQLATAFTRLHPAYVGRWSVKGAREQTEVKRPADAADARRYESEGVKKGTMDQSETGWIGKDAKGAQGSQVEVSSQMGGAHLRFD